MRRCRGAAIVSAIVLLVSISSPAAGVDPIRGLGPIEPRLPRPADEGDVRILPGPAVGQSFPGANGRIAFSRRHYSEPSQIWTINVDGSDPVQLTDSATGDGGPSWSPDGSLIVFARDQTEEDLEDGDIYLMNADGSGLRQLTDTPEGESCPAFSPDGTRIVFCSNRDTNDGSFDIYTMDLDGNDIQRLTNAAGNHVGPDWSPDGSRIAFQSDRDSPGNFDIYTMDPDGSDVTRLTTHPEGDYGPVWSPDGTRIAFWSTRPDGEILVMDADGSDVVNLTASLDDVVRGPAWSPDGSMIVYCAAVLEGPVDFDLAAMSADGDYLGEIAASTEDSDCGPDWQPLPMSPTVPSPPTSVKARTGAARITVSWQPPVSDGGAPVTGYVATSSPPGGSCSVDGSVGWCSVTGLAEGIRYTFTVTASNAAGLSPPSEPSNAVAVLRSIVPRSPVLRAAVVRQRSWQRSDLRLFGYARPAHDRATRGRSMTDAP